jgi:hypothetical protein
MPATKDTVDSKLAYKEYQYKTYTLKMARKNRYLALACLDEIFPGFQGNRKEKLINIHNALFGKSFDKAQTLGLMDFIDKEYKKLIP